MISGQCVFDIFLLAWLINVITKKKNIPTAYTEKKVIYHAYIITTNLVENEDEKNFIWYLR